MTEPTQLIEQLARSVELSVPYLEIASRTTHDGTGGEYKRLEAKHRLELLTAALTAARAHLEQPTEPDCVGGSPCTTCADKQACATGCVRMSEFLGSPAPSTAGERDRTIVSLPIPASASDLKSDIAELIQSHKYKKLLSIEVLGVFQFLGAEIISGSNS